MQVIQPGLFSRGKILLERPAPHITPDSLLQELQQAWGARGFEVYKSALFGLDVAIKQSGTTGIALKIKQDNGATVIAYNAFAPSALVRMLALGLIPILIINATSWKPLLRSFEQYVRSSPFFTGGQLGGAMAQLPQAVAQYPCATCGTSLQWVAEHQRWFCGRCQQYR